MTSIPKGASLSVFLYICFVSDPSCGSKRKKTGRMQRCLPSCKSQNLGKGILRWSLDLASKKIFRSCRGKFGLELHGANASHAFDRNSKTVFTAAFSSTTVLEEVQWVQVGVRDEKQSSCRKRLLTGTKCFWPARWLEERSYISLRI